MYKIIDYKGNCIKDSFNSKVDADEWLCDYIDELFPHSSYNQQLFNDTYSNYKIISY